MKVRDPIDLFRQLKLPVELWYESVGDPTLADYILDHLVHNAYRLDLRGDSLRKARGIGMLNQSQNP
jgi:hypothetical protein